MRGNLTDERKSLLQSLVDEGTPIKEMWRKHRFSYATVRRHHPTYRLASDGYRLKDRVLTDEELRAALEPYRAERVPCKVAGQALGVDYRRIREMFPDMTWTKEETLEYANQVRKLGRIKVIG